MLVEFATAAEKKYAKEQCPTALHMLFTEDFKLREEKYFRSVPNEDTIRLRNVLMQKRVVLRPRPFLAFRAVSEVIRDLYSALLPQPSQKRRAKGFRLTKPGMPTWAHTQCGRH